MQNSSGFISFNLKPVNCAEKDYVKYVLDNAWNPLSNNFKDGNYPVVNWSQYRDMAGPSKGLCMVVYSPITDDTTIGVAGVGGFKSNSIYVIAKNLVGIAKQLERDKDSHGLQLFNQDFEMLARILRSNGFIGYPVMRISSRLSLQMITFLSWQSFTFHCYRQRGRSLMFMARIGLLF